MNAPKTERPLQTWGTRRPLWRMSAFQRISAGRKGDVHHVVPKPNARGQGGERHCGAAGGMPLFMFYRTRLASTQAVAMARFVSGQSKESSASVLRPGVMSLCPA